MHTSGARRMTTAFCVLFVAICSLGSGAQEAANPVVFRIGRFDRSSGEFASGDPKQPVNFAVGKGDAAKEWYAFQPALGASNPKNSVASAPRSIAFSLESAPSAQYRLHVALLVENAAVPALKVTINGKSGRFYLHPKLDYSNGDQGDSFFPAYSSADVEFTFPGNYLRTGANTIALQVVQQADESVPDAGLAYDAIELDRDTANAASQTPVLQLEPTIFYNQQNGELLETVDAFVRHIRPLPRTAKARPRPRRKLVPCRPGGRRRFRRSEGRVRGA